MAGRVAVFEVGHLRVVVVGVVVGANLGGAALGFFLKKKESFQFGKTPVRWTIG